MENCRFSDFTIVKQLGEGGFGSAYLAVHNPHKMQVCLKWIRAPNQSAFDEAKTLSQLEDKHIVKYYGSFVEDDILCIVMEYAAGNSLFDEIKVSNLFFF